VPPLKSEFSRSWSTYGQAEALFLVVKEAWRLHCIVSGIDPADCPMDGVFDAIKGADKGGASSGK